MVVDSVLLIQQSSVFHVSDEFQRPENRTLRNATVDGKMEVFTLEKEKDWIGCR